jgi:hypothetical protein
MDARLDLGRPWSCPAPVPWRMAASASGPRMLTPARRFPHRGEGGPRRIRAVGRFGDVTFQGSHASIKLDEAASVRLTTLAGDVSGGRLNGPAEISIGKG